jgi:hypothetical protein
MFPYKDEAVERGHTHATYVLAMSVTESYSSVNCERPHSFKKNSREQEIAALHSENNRLRPPELLMCLWKGDAFGGLSARGDAKPVI